MEFLKETVTDADGNIYHTVKIGNQVWTTENLRTTKYNDGTAIPLVTDENAWSSLNTPGYCWYRNDKDNMNKYGALYNWYAVDTGKLAPRGWHVPSDKEWDIFENYLIANGYNWDRTTVGNKIAKSLAAKGWETGRAHPRGTIGNDLTENNRSGFSALPGGSRRSDGSFGGIYEYGYWWSASEGDAPIAFGRSLSCGGDNLSKYGVYFDPKGSGVSVRLLQD